MTRTLYLFSSDLERDAAFDEGARDERNRERSDERNREHSNERNGASDFPLIRIAGVGLVDAAIGTVRAIYETQPDSVVYIGTCGAHRASGLAIGNIVVAASACIGSGDIARNEMRMPTLLASEIACDGDLSSELITQVATSTERRVASVRVSCTLGVTESDALAEALCESNRCDVENLEAFAVVRAASPIPTAVILGVTNIVGIDGGRDWHANFRAMMKRLGECAVVAPSRNVDTDS